MAEQEFIEPFEEKSFLDKAKEQILKNKYYFIAFGIVFIFALYFLFFGNETNRLFQGFIGTGNQNEEPPGTELTENGPTLVNVSPADNEVISSTEAGALKVVFQENDLLFDETQDAVILKSGENVDLSTAPMTYNEATNTLSIPYSQLENNSTYTVSIPASTIINFPNPLSEDLEWTFSVGGEEFVPPDLSENNESCTDGDLLNANSEICFENDYIVCSNAAEGLTLDELDVVCESGSWTTPDNGSSSPPDGPPSLQTGDNSDSCTEGDIINGSSEVCSDGSYILCSENTEGFEIDDLGVICKNEEWILSEVCSDGELESNDSEVCFEDEFYECEANNQGQVIEEIDFICDDEEWVSLDDFDIRITDIDIDPDQFNPTMEEAKITFSLNGDAEIEMEIIDESNEPVIELFQGDLMAGDHFGFWNGTDELDDSGDLVTEGTYFYKITARDNDSGDVLDIATGQVTVEYQDDFENGGQQQTPESVNTTNSSNSQPSPQPVNQQTQAAATMAMQNTQSGTTAGTGPGVLVYFLFPVLGIFSPKLWKK